MNQTIRSPSYPAMPLVRAVELVTKAEKVFSNKPAHRDDVMTEMGFRPTSGSAQKALADVKSYGLLDRAKQGEVMVTELAKKILFPRDEIEKARSIEQAANSPKLFRDLNEYFSESNMPSREAVINYLRRENFNPKSVNSAARAYLNTREYLENIRENGEKDNDEVNVMTTESTEPVKLKPGYEAEIEWFKVRVGNDIVVRVLCTEELGTHEIDNLIKMIEVQKLVLRSEPKTVLITADGEETEID